MSEYDIYAAMQEGKEPLAKYTKTIVGKVHVVALNPFNDNPEGVMLGGKNGDNESSIELWTNKQVLFFERMNKSHITAGRITKSSTQVVKEVQSPNQLSEEEIVSLLNDKFLSLRARVEKFTDIAPVLRLVNKARELEKSEKIIKFLEQKMAQLEIEKYE